MFIVWYFKGYCLVIKCLLSCILISCVCISAGYLLQYTLYIVHSSQFSEARVKSTIAKRSQFKWIAKWVGQCSLLHQGYRGYLPILNQQQVLNVQGTLFFFFFLDREFRNLSLSWNVETFPLHGIQKLFHYMEHKNFSLTENIGTIHIRELGTIIIRVLEPILCREL